MIVVDSCALVDLALGGDEVGAWVAVQVMGVERLAAPHVVDVELLGACRSLERRGIVSPAAAREALETLSEVPVDRYPHPPLKERMWELRHHVTAADAAYVALAEALDVPLVTTDRRLSRTHGTDCQIVAP
jgi:predicted nucleic acid-binding protein